MSEFSFTNGEFIFDDIRYTRFRNFTHNQEFDVEGAEGSGVEIEGWGRGALQPGEGECEFLIDELDTLISNMGHGYMLKEFEIVATYTRERDGATRTDKLLGCRFSNLGEHEGERGPDPLYETIAFKFRKRLRNGIDPVNVNASTT